MAKKNEKNETVEAVQTPVVEKTGASQDDAQTQTTVEGVKVKVNPELDTE